MPARVADRALELVSAALLASVLFMAAGGLSLLGWTPAAWPRAFYVLPFLAYLFLAAARSTRPSPPFVGPRSSRIAWSGLIVLAIVFMAMPLFANPMKPFPRGMVETRYWSNIGIIIMALLVEVYVQRRRHGPDDRPSGQWAFLALVAFPLYILYTGNGQLFSFGDNTATKHLPSVILARGTVALDGLPPYSGADVHYTATRIGGRLLPTFPLGTGFLSVPYTAAALAASGGVVNDALLDRWEKHAAALMATASAALLFFASRGAAGPGPAAATAVVFGVCTTEFSTASQGLWSVTGLNLLVTLALALALPAVTGAGWRLAAAGAAMGGAFLCRPTSLVIAVLLAAAFSLIYKRRVIWFMAGLAGALVAAVLLQIHIYGHPLGAYGLVNAGMWARDPLPGFLGNLLSPGRGLLVYFPYLLLIPAGIRFVRGHRTLEWMLGVSTAITLAVYALASIYLKWWGGHSIGPRLMTEAAPFIAVSTLPLWTGWARLGWMRWVFLGLLSWAGLTQFIGTYTPVVYRWNALVDVDRRPEALWSWKDGQLAATWIPGWRMPVEPYRAPGDEIGGDPSRWLRLDLGPFANARYDWNPFSGDVGDGKTEPYFGRIDSVVQNTALALFHFAPRGRPNCLTTGNVGTTPAVVVPSLRAHRLHAILSADQTGRQEQQPAVASWEISYADSTCESLPIRLNADVYAYRPDHRSRAFPVERVYRGQAREADALIQAVFEISHPETSVTSLRLVMANPRSRAVVCLLALTLELPPASGTSAR